MELNLICKECGNPIEDHICPDMFNNYWVDIREEKPDENEKVLFYHPYDGDYYCGYWSEDENCMVEYKGVRDGGYKRAVSYWKKIEKLGDIPDRGKSDKDDNNECYSLLRQVFDFLILLEEHENYLLKSLYKEIVDELVEFLRNEGYLKRGENEIL